MRVFLVGHLILILIFFFCTMDGFFRILEKTSSELIDTRLYLLKLSDTEKGINGLQRQLESRDQELADERSKRQVLERHFEKKTQHRLINDLAKQRSRVQMGAYF